MCSNKDLSGLDKSDVRLFIRSFLFVSYLLQGLRMEKDDSHWWDENVFFKDQAAVPVRRQEKLCEYKICDHRQQCP